MSLIEQARKDIARITGNDRQFGQSLEFTSPQGDEVTVTGLHAKHHFGVDTDGNLVNSRNVHVSVSEENFGVYPIRVNGEINFINHIVRAKDSSNQFKTYRVRSAHPDETVGLIVLILESNE